MSPETKEEYLNLDSPDYPHTTIRPMPESACQQVIEDGWVQVNPEEIDLPSRCAQWLLQGDIFTRRRSDLEEKFTSSPTIIEIKQSRRVAIIVIVDESLPCEEVKFKAYNPNNHRDIDSIELFNATPAEAVKLLELTEPFSEAPDLAQKLQNTRKARASRGIKNTASLA